MIKMNCPNCKRSLQIPTQRAGQTTECEHCQHKFAVPASASKFKSALYIMGGIGVILIGVEMFLQITAPEPEYDYKITQIPAEESKPPPPLPTVEIPGEKLLREARSLASSDYKAAAEAFEKVREEYPETIKASDGLYFAAIYAQLGEPENHEALCRWMFEKFPGDKDAIAASQTGKAYVLYPGADNAELLAHAAKQIDYGAEAPDGGHVHRRNVARGMAEYRLKNYQKAIGWLEKEVENEDPYMQSLALAYTAMVEHAQGNTPKSLERLDATRTVTATFPRFLQGQNTVRVGPMISMCALNEAEMLLGQPITAYTPRTKTLPETAKEATELAFYGKYQEAVQLFEGMLAEDPDNLLLFHGYLIAILYAQSDDHAKHEAHCQWMFEKFPGDKDATAASRTGKAYVLYSGADNAELLAHAAKRIDYGAERASDGANHFQTVARGIAAYRLKNYQEAREWLEKEVGNEAPAIQSLALAYAAMVEHELGNTSKSLEHLAAARTVVADFPELSINTNRRRFVNYLISKIALNEAETLLGQPITPDTPTALSPDEQLGDTNELTDQP